MPGHFTAMEQLTSGLSIDKPKHKPFGNHGDTQPMMVAQG